MECVPSKSSVNGSIAEEMDVEEKNRPSNSLFLGPSETNELSVIWRQLKVSMTFFFACLHNKCIHKYVAKQTYLCALPA